jgi:hypothetical protein
MRNRDRLRNSSRINRARTLGAMVTIALCIGFVAVPAMAAVAVPPDYSATPTDPVVAANPSEMVNNPAAALPGPAIPLRPTVQPQPTRSARAALMPDRKPLLWNSASSKWES